jgi:acetyl esterase
MRVNPSELKVFAELENQTQQNQDLKLDEMTIEQFRAMAKSFMQYTGEAADVPFKDMTVPARDDYPIPIRIYNDQLDATVPVFIMYPGCGYLQDLFEVNGVAASRIAKYGNIKVILVNFRLCPEVKMPVPVYDAYDATKYIAVNSKKFAINPAGIFIGGVSSGAHAATNVAIMARDEKTFRVKHQILMNGMYDLTESHNDYRNYELEDKICRREATGFMFAQYGMSGKDFSKPVLSPVFNSNIQSMPDTTFLIAEYDGLRSDSEAYYQHLNSQNDNIARMLLPGQTHNTILMRGVMTDGEDPALTIANIINKIG